MGRIAVFLLLALVVLPMLGRDSLNMSATQRKASPFAYDLVGWEMGNFMAKWWHRAKELFPSSERNRDAKAMVEEFFRLGERLRRLQDERVRQAALAGGDRSTSLSSLEAELAQVRQRRRELQPFVEETLEGIIGHVLAQEGIPFTIGPLRFPPVDFTFAPEPFVLVTSPRERIERVDNVLLRPSVTVEEMERVEEAIFKEQHLSALVVGTAGVATYPAVISPNASLHNALITASHEWLHHFLFFRPLGQNLLASGDMFTLNETLAQIIGEEIGDRAYHLFTGEELPPRQRIPVEPPVPRALEEREFEFNQEMQKTRLQVDELLAQGMVEEAETYMEERRQLFVEKGYYIRKLNQAYFAFHGTYADSPASTSPILRELEEARELYPSLREFIRSVSGVSTYDQFKELLEHLRVQAGATSSPPG